MKNRVKVSLIIIMIIAASLVAVVFSACNKKAKTYTVVYVAGEHGTIYGETEQSIESGNSAKTITAVPETGYYFVNWSDGNSNATRTDTNVTEDINVTAQFAKITYRLYYVAGEHGKLVGETSQSVEYGDSAQSVTAIAHNGYRFVKWSDGNTDAERTDNNVKSTINVTAIFERITFTVRYSSTVGGSIQGNVAQTVVYRGFSQQVTAVANTGYRFVKWSDGNTNATRQETEVLNNFYLTAEFEKIEEKTIYSVLYIAMEGGTIQGETYQTVEKGNDATTVTAVPNQCEHEESYVFLCWSDGVTTEERHDTNITRNMRLTAYFGYTINYVANNNIGGRIEGKANQKLLFDEVSEEVTAVPNEGYVFCGWSDLSLKTSRNGDMLEQKGVYAIYEYIAYFEPIEKTFKYNYGVADGSAYVKEITLNRNAINNAKFMVPECEGYTFCGWYADSDYRIRITDVNGRYMYGYAAFSLETDTLYAKWEKKGEETDNHKILMIFVDEVNTELYSTVIQQNIKIHSKMTAIEYEMSRWLTETINSLLNEWFNGEVVFEVDAYYTTEVVEEGFTGSRESSGHTSYHLFAPDISEVATLSYSYHNTLTTISYGKDTLKLWLADGTTDMKDACVSRRHFFSSSNGKPFQNYLNSCKRGEIDVSDIDIVDTYLHELAHTTHQKFILSEEDLDLHTAIDYAEEKYGKSKLTNTIKPYLLGEFEIDGKMCGVPMEYWKHQTSIHINYWSGLVNKKKPGKIVVIGEEEDPDRESVSRNVVYGSEITVEAVSFNGYRFVRWKDGIETAVRHDVNIIAHINVKAIFEKI